MPSSRPALGMVKVGGSAASEAGRSMVGCMACSSWSSGSGRVGTATAGTGCVTATASYRTARPVVGRTVGSPPVTAGPVGRELSSRAAGCDRYALLAPTPAAIAQPPDRSRRRCCGNRLTRLSTLRHPFTPEDRRRPDLAVRLACAPVCDARQGLATIASSAHEAATQTGTGSVQQLGRAMLNIGRMGPGRAGYCLTAVARGSEGVEGYYLARGEEPGRWLGHGSEILGLSGEVTGPLMALAEVPRGCSSNFPTWGWGGWGQASHPA